MVSTRATILLVTGTLLTGLNASALSPLPHLQNPVPGTDEGVPANGSLWFSGLVIEDGSTVLVGLNDETLAALPLQRHGDAAADAVYEVGPFAISNGDTVRIESDLFQDAEELVWTVGLEDTAAPTWPEDAALGLGSEGPSATCTTPLPPGGPCGIGVNADFPAAADSSGIAFYRIVDEEGEEQAIVPGHRTHGMNPPATPRGVTLFRLGPESRTECFRVAPVDVAGNVGSDLEECIELQGLDGGCACLGGADGAAKWTSILVLGLVLPLTRRRRHPGR